MEEALRIKEAADKVTHEAALAEAERVFLEEKADKEAALAAEEAEKQAILAEEEAER